MANKPRKRVLVPPDPATVDKPRTRGRPKKDPNQPKAEYKLSDRERARRSVQMRLRNAKKSAATQQQKAEYKKRKVKKLTESADKIEKALQGEKTRVIDQGDLTNLPDAVSDLVDGSPVKPNPGPEFLARLKEMYFTVVPGGKSFASWPILCATVTTLIIVGFGRTRRTNELIDKRSSFTPRRSWEPPSESKSVGFPPVQPCGSPPRQGQDVTRFQGQLIGTTLSIYALCPGLPFSLFY